jgi:uncharacterized membrane protein YccC
VYDAAVSATEVQDDMMPFWQRLAITVIAIAVCSLLAGLLWNWIFGFVLPSYAGGVIGGLAALPVWEFLKRRKPAKR